MIEKVIQSAVANYNEQDVDPGNGDARTSPRPGSTRARSSSGSSRRTAARRTRS